MMSYEAVLTELARADDRLVVLTAENRAPIRGVPAALGDRFIDTGITEQALVGMSAGLALRGRIPVAHALAAFLTQRAFEFIRTDVGIAGLPVKLVGYVPGVLSTANGPTHQALEDVALMRGIPGMGVFCPADAEDLALGIAAVVRHPGPWYLRYIDRPPSVPHQGPFQLGQAEVLERGTDVAILAYGALFWEGYQAARHLRDDGLTVRLANLRTLQPIDEAEVLVAASTTRLLVTLEDHFLTGGLYSIVSEILVRHRLRARVLPIALDGRWFRPGRLQDVLQHERLLGRQLAGRITQRLEGPDVH
jgi:transketolase